MTAVAWLEQGRVDAVLVGGVDQLCHAHAYAWHVHRQTQKAVREAEKKERPVPLAGEGACFLVLKAVERGATPYPVIRETGLGRASTGPLPQPSGDFYILGEGGLAATRADYGKWILPGARATCYAHVYGDMTVDSAFDTAIAALSRRNNRIYPAGSAAQPLELPADHSIVCLKLGVGNTYGWTIFD
jgi:3-oxoacyl-[acyl-carrier-protein] synthase II